MGSPEAVRVRCRNSSSRSTGEVIGVFRESLVAFRASSSERLRLLKAVEVVPWRSTWDIELLDFDQKSGHG